MSAIRDAAYRLAEQLPRFAHRAANATSGDEAYRARRALADALVVFGEACAGRGGPAPSALEAIESRESGVAHGIAIERERVRKLARECDDPSAFVMDLLSGASDAPPPVDIRLAADELDAVIVWAEHWAKCGAMSPTGQAALAKLRAARGTR